MTQFNQGKPPEIPLHAAYIWAEGQDIYLSLRGIVVKLPKSGRLMTNRFGEIIETRHGKTQLEVALVSTLREHEAAPRDSIGTPADPTQAQVKSLPQEIADRWLAEAKIKKAQAKAQAEAEAKAKLDRDTRELLDELGL